LNFVLFVHFRELANALSGLLMEWYDIPRYVSAVD